MDKFCMGDASASDWRGAKMLLDGSLSRPLRVITGPTAAPRGRSAPGGEADEIGGKADDAARRSALGGRAVVPATWPETPGVAITGTASVL